MAERWKQTVGRAGQYLRTAQAALQAGDMDASFECARTAAELAAKALLTRHEVPFSETHNVAGALVKAGLWPRGRGSDLSEFLSAFVQGVTAFGRELQARDVEKGIRLAGELVKRAGQDA